MNADWMLDVLADLKTFAHDNRFARLAEHLDDSILVAAAELDAAKRRARGEAVEHEREAGIGYHRTGFGKKS